MTPNAGFLYGARALQGAFGALLAPAALSLMTVTFHAPKERARAFGVFGAVSGGGAAVGLLLGGVLTEYLSWRWCLLINTPIAIVAGLLALRYVRESRASGGTSYDVAGALTVTIGLVALVYGFTKAAPKGLQDTAHWGEASTLIWFVLAAVLLVAFFVVEARHPNPLLPLRILLERNRGGSYLIMLIVGIGMFAMFLFLGLYLQVVRGYTPIAAGFAFLPFSAGIVVGAGIASQLVPRLGPRPVLVPGLLASAVALVWMSRLTVDSSYVGHLLPAMLIMSVGMAFVFIPIATTALHGIGHEDAGVGSALINTAQQIGGSVGVALLNTVAVIATTSFLTEHAADGPGALPEALTAGYTRAFLVGAVINVVAAVLALVLINIGREAAQEGDEEGEVAVVHAG
jgi:EmrB/QacA subfamily drug resistance transporter